MGGLGSGNRYRLDKKTTTDDCHSLDIRDLYREGLLKPGGSFRSSWSRAGKEVTSIRGFVYQDQVVLSYRHRNGLGGEWEDVKEPVSLEWTPCNFGGERPWFVCPGVVNGVACGRRVAVLYGPGKYFLCSHCYDLCYESQREDKKDRALKRARKIRRHLGESANMLESFPARPKGMHHDTYMRLFWEHHEAEMQHLAGMRERLDNMREGLDRLEKQVV
jgi:hypothetical protein